MKTEEYILAEHTNIDIDKIDLPDLSEDELSNIEQLVEFTRHFQEINQLYRIFQVNLNEILSHYRLNVNDKIENIINNNDEEDIIIVNALVINYISSAKTFVESIENFIADKLGQSNKDLFKKSCLSSIYDDTFSYRLLIRLRDYAQHGHLPVYESWDKKYSFDLDQIVNTPHYNHNSKLKEELNKIRDEIARKYTDNPRIVFSRSIAEFQLRIIEIYKLFIDWISPQMEHLVTQLDELVKKRPEIVHSSKDELNGQVLYKIEDECLHMITPNENIMDMLELVKDDIKRNYEIQKKKFEESFKQK